MGCSAGGRHGTDHGLERITHAGWAKALLSPLWHCLFHPAGAHLRRLPVQHDCKLSRSEQSQGRSRGKALPDSCAACWMGRSAIALQCTMAEIILQTAHAASATTTGQQKPNATSMAVGQALPDGRTACWMGSTAKRLSLRLPSCWKASSSNTCRMPEHAFHDGCAPPNGCTACRRAGASLP